MELVRSSVSIASGLPRETVRSAPAIVFSRPAQRSLTLWPARSRSRLATLSIESSNSFVASAAASIATGWSEPVPGRELHPLKSSAFHGALFHQLANEGDTATVKAKNCLKRRFADKGVLMGGGRLHNGHRATSFCWVSLRDRGHHYFRRTWDCGGRRVESFRGDTAASRP